MPPFALNLLRSGDTPHPTGTVAATDDAAETAPARAVVCAACGHVVTTPEARTEVDGRHVHSFVNPSGLAFTIACYRVAPGCAGEGEPTTFWTWFPGYAWQIALCGACGRHLGWRFQSPDDGFHGLIAERVVVADEPG